MVVLKMAQSLQAMASTGWMHRDVSLDNLLYSTTVKAFDNVNDFDVFISDFGCAKHSEDPIKLLRGNCRLYPPESLADTLNYSFNADVFMFGMCLYTVLSGLLPFDT